MPDAANPTDLSYHPDHGWARVDGNEAVFGITSYAEGQLGEVVFLDFRKVGDEVAQGSSYAEIESIKAVSDVIAPLSGEIVEVNTALADAPETVNRDPYDAGWLVRVRLSEPSEIDSLLDADAYEASLGGD